MLNRLLFLILSMEYYLLPLLPTGLSLLAIIKNKRGGEKG